jgi:radical SAM superfamily enzyme YgiQ (UPF0313 family)
VKVLLISTYELGRQPFGLASPAAWLRARGHYVACADLACGTLPVREAREADAIAVYVPMHTATRLAAALIPKLRVLNPGARLACYGLYAPVNEPYLRSLGVDAVLGGEFEAALAAFVERAGGPQAEPVISLERLAFLPPDRADLPPLARYAAVRQNGTRRVAGYTEASRGCKHLCRHCPVVPVYGGRFRVVPREVVLEDIRRQVAAGAEHISFGDPDFLNGPAHSAALVESLHEAFPDLTYDVTVKVEHLIRHARLLPLLAATGCLFVTSAFESVDDEVLRKLDKGHTRADAGRALELAAEAGLTLAPTFVAFHPWTTPASYRDLLAFVLERDLADHVAPVQLAVRLLIPAGSQLLELDEVRSIAGPFDSKALSHPWPFAAEEVHELADSVDREVKAGGTRREIFARIWKAAHGAPPPDFHLVSRATIPYMTEPWFC